MKNKLYIYFILGVFIFALINNGKHMFLAYTVINPHAYDGGLINPVLSQIFAVLSILVFECSVFILTLQGAKKYAATCAVISYVIITTYLSIESYNANGGFTYAWGLSTFSGFIS